MIPLFRVHDDSYRHALAVAIERVFASRWYVLGAEVAAFEREFADYCRLKHCVGVANGTDALELALRGVGITAGDTVALAANAGFYASTAVHLVGATPHYVDVDERTLVLSPQAVERAIRQRKPRAVIVTHLYGHLADVDGITALTRKEDIPLIEDCAQAHGASRSGRAAGSFGSVGCFSFYPTKNLGAVGDAGALTTDDTALATRLRELRQYGWSEKYHVEVAGGRNSRLDEMQAALLRQKLPYLDGWNRERRSIAARYNQALAGLPVRCPPSLAEDFVSHLYVIRCDRRDALRQHLHDTGVGTAIHYPVPDHLQPAYPSPQPEGSLPVTEEACRTVLSLPCFPGLAPSEQDIVISAVHQFFQSDRSSC